MEYSDDKSLMLHHKYAHVASYVHMHLYVCTYVHNTAYNEGLILSRNLFPIVNLVISPLLMYSEFEFVLVGQVLKLAMVYIHNN